MRSPFVNLDSGGGARGGVFVEDEFAFEAGGGRSVVAIAEFERRQVERDRAEAERRQRLLNALDDMWRGSRGVRVPLWQGLERAGAVAALPFLAARRVGHAIDDARASGQPVGSAVRGALGGLSSDFLESPGELGFGEVARAAGLPEAVGTVADFLAPGPDIAPLAKLAADLPPAMAFLLPLARNVASGTWSEKSLEEIQNAIDANIADPKDREEAAGLLSRFVFDLFEFKSTALYPANSDPYHVHRQHWEAQDDLTFLLRSIVGQDPIPGHRSSLPTPSWKPANPTVTQIPDYDDLTATNVIPYTDDDYANQTRLGTEVTRNFSPNIDPPVRRLFSEYVGARADMDILSREFGFTPQDVTMLKGGFGDKVYAAINNMARDFQETGTVRYLSNTSQQAAIRMFDQIAENFRTKVRLPAATTAYRGMLISPRDSLMDAGTTLGWFLSDSFSDRDDIIGALIPNRGFTSVSEDPSWAYSFVRTKKHQPVVPGSLGVMFQMVLPKDSPALPLYGHKNAPSQDFIGNVPREHEIILPMGTDFRVLNYEIKTPRGGGNPYVFFLVEPVFPFANP